ncbi:unnamed protein product [Heligmosomoides polygyrus]|uniref:DUF5641 domain-containing protein n=1 Tax=Heligmosomoides polygyrus TaxID=6339 RepID=A0A183G8W4_HELPZ|nr:unnamed protein product [Heligmosomoides polygyrus]
MDTTPRLQLVTSTMHLGRISLNNTQFATGPDSKMKAEKRKKCLEMAERSVHKALSAYTSAADKLDSDTPQMQAILEKKPLRPIDFLVREIKITYPFENLQDDKKDPSYLPPAELAHLQTQRQAEEALLSSHKLTEQYWKIWHNMYLSSLRESRKLQMDKKRSGTKFPMVDTVVLLADPNSPRNTWRMGRITELKGSANTEATVRMPNGSCLRRPINLLIPLELEDQSEHKALERKTRSIIHLPNKRRRATALYSDAHLNSNVAFPTETSSLSIAPSRLSPNENISELHISPTGGKGIFIHFGTSHVLDRRAVASPAQEDSRTAGKAQEETTSCRKGRRVDEAIKEEGEGSIGRIIRKATALSRRDTFQSVQPLEGVLRERSRSLQSEQEKIDALEAKTTARRLVVRRTVVLEKKLEEHHDYVRLNSQPTELTINEEQMGQLLSRLTSETSALEHSLQEDIEIAKNAVLFQVGEISKDVDKCRTEVEKASNNSVMYEIKELTGRFTRFKAVEQKQELLPKVLSVVEEIKSLIDTSKDKGDETTTEKEQTPTEEPPKDEDLLCIDDDEVFEQQPVTEKEPEKIEDYNDKKILDELANVNRNLKKTRHEIFVMNHRIEDERKNTSPRSRQKVEDMRKEKYELMDEEYSLKKKQQELNLALQDWMKHKGRHESPRHKESSSSTRTHGSAPRRSSSSPCTSRRGV